MEIVSTVADQKLKKARISAVNPMAIRPGLTITFIGNALTTEEKNGLKTGTGKLDNDFEYGPSGEAEKNAVRYETNCNACCANWDCVKAETSCSKFLETF